VCTPCRRRLQALLIPVKIGVRKRGGIFQRFQVRKERGRRKGGPNLLFDGFEELMTVVNRPSSWYEDVEGDEAARAGGWGYTVRLRAPTPLTVDGVATTGRHRLATGTPGRWTATRAAYGTGPRAVPGTLVVGRGLPTVPWHQHGPASLAARARRAARRRS
jgi:hypothetical protein